jgi:hypothetical protein
VLAACGPSSSSDLAEGSPLSGARTSPEALAEAALVALQQADTASLRALLVSRDEYEQVLWPLLPDRDYVTFEFVWGMSAPRNRKALRNLLADYGTLELELVNVDLGTEIEEHDGLTLYREARMTVRRTDNGVEGMLPLMDAVVHIGGGWKFLNYRDDA